MAEINLVLTKGLMHTEECFCPRIETMAMIPLKRLNGVYSVLLLQIT
jgi:hypothetical protein